LSYGITLVAEKGNKQFSEFTYDVTVKLHNITVRKLKITADQNIFLLLLLPQKYTSSWAL